MLRPTKKLVRVTATLFVTAIVILAVNSVIQNRHFRVVKSIPQTNGIVATSTNGFELDFNKDLRTNLDYSKNLNDPTHLVSRIRISQRAILIETGPLHQSAHYSFYISNIQSMSGEVINKVSFSFTAKYVPDKKMPKDQKALITKISNLYLDDYPLLRHLPYSTLDYSLQAVFNQTESQRLGPPVIQARLLLTHADTNGNAAAAINSYKQEVFNYITGLGFNPQAYNIDFVVIQPTT